MNRYYHHLHRRKRMRQTYSDIIENLDKSQYKRRKHRRMENATKGSRHKKYDLTGIPIDIFSALCQQAVDEALEEMQ